MYSWHPQEQGKERCERQTWYCDKLASIEQDIAASASSLVIQLRRSALLGAVNSFVAALVALVASHRFPARR